MHISAQIGSIWPVPPHESVNVIEFKNQYHKNKDIWDAAFHFLANNDLEQLPVGNYVIIQGKCWATVSTFLKKLKRGILRATAVLLIFSIHFGGMKKWGWRKMLKCVWITMQNEMLHFIHLLI